MTPTNDESKSGAPAGSVASREDNAKLEHSVEGSTTRDDRLDAGVPVLQGDPREPVGPEDAAGEGPKRGDYSSRVTGEIHESRPVDVDGDGGVYRYVNRNTGAEAKEGDKDAVRVRVDNAPLSELVPQAPRASDQGEVAGRKGGVNSTEPALK